MTARTAAIVLLAAGIAIVYYLHDTLLLAFAGVLLALIVRASADRIFAVTRIPAVLGVWITVVLVAAALLLCGMLLGNTVTEQVRGLQASLPAAFHNTLVQLRAGPGGAWIVANLPRINQLMPDSIHLLSRATGLLSGALGAAGGLLIILFVAIASALEPGLYTGGFIALIPAPYRARARSVLAEIASTLRIWLLARLATMVVTGVLVTAGLTVLHIPMAAALGLLAAMLAFIPNIGAIAAAIPALLLAFSVSMNTVIAVTVMYVIVHILDDFVVAPVLERQVVKLPPVLTLLAQVVLGLGAGLLGIMLAAPLVAAAIVLVRATWIEQVAGKDTSGPQSAAKDGDALRSRECIVNESLRISP